MAVLKEGKNLIAQIGVIIFGKIFVGNSLLLHRKFPESIIYFLSMNHLCCRYEFLGKFSLYLLFKKKTDGQIIFKKHNHKNNLPISI